MTLRKINSVVEVSTQMQLWPQKWLFEREIRKKQKQELKEFCDIIKQISI